MPLKRRQPSFARPTAVAVHDDGEMLRDGGFHKDSSVRDTAPLDKSAKKPYRRAMHRIEGKPLQAIGFRVLQQLVFKLADKIIVKNQSLSAIIHLPSAKSIYLSNGVDIKIFKPRPKRFSKVPTVLYVGRLEPQKNLAVLLTALALKFFPQDQLQPNGKASTFHLVGRVYVLVLVNLEQRLKWPHRFQQRLFHLR